MGSGAADKLKEIEDLRASLGQKLEELEARLPLAGLGKKAAAAMAGSSVAGTALAFGVRRLRSGRKKKKRAAAAELAPTSVVVNVFPKGAAWLAAAGLAGWAGFKLYQAARSSGMISPGGSPARPSVVKPMPESGRQSGS